MKNLIRFDFNVAMSTRDTVTPRWMNLRYASFPTISKGLINKTPSCVSASGRFDESSQARQITMFPYGSQGRDPSFFILMLGRRSATRKPVRYDDACDPGSQPRRESPYNKTDTTGSAGVFTMAPAERHYLETTQRVPSLL